MPRTWTQIDLHIVWILLLSFPVVFLGTWWLILPLAMPQGRICCHAMDKRKSGRPCGAYLVANEMLVVVVVGIFLGVCLLLTGRTGDG